MKRLNIGASRFERMPLKAIKAMDDPTWIHLGDSPLDWKTNFKQEWKSGNFYYCARILYRVIKPRYTKEQLNSFYETTDFRGFYYQIGDRLDFEDNTFDFICSEHFFEHLFLEEAFELIKECYRILKPHGVIRFIVPDADLRTYTKMEPISNMPLSHPEFHKTRWSIYSLPLIIKLAGLVPHPIIYCDKYGEFFQNFPSKSESIYSQSTDPEFVFSLDYIQRLNSLIVDGVKVPIQI